MQWRRSVVIGTQEVEPGGSQAQNQPQKLGETCLKVRNKKALGCSSVEKHPGFNSQ